MKKDNEKTAQAMPFNWIFAVIVGGIIIFLAIFSAIRFIDIQRYKADTEIANQFSTILNPLETTVASAIATKLKMSGETRLQITCKFTGIGKEDLRISTKSNVGAAWQGYGAVTSMHNKYIFANAIEEGEDIYLFSKTFSMPFKIADLIYLSTENFCFISPPYAMDSELHDLEMENVQVVANKGSCKEGSKTVCFGSSGCEINVYGQCYGYECSSSYGEYDYGVIENRESGNREDIELLYYVSPELLYAAIFSSPDIYRCNLNRLMYRINLVSRLYMEKINLLKVRGCNTGELALKLSELALHASYLTSSDNIISIKDPANEADSINSGLICTVF